MSEQEDDSIIRELTEALGEMIDAVDDCVVHVRPSDLDEFLVILTKANAAHKRGMS